MARLPESEAKKTVRQIALQTPSESTDSTRIGLADLRNPGEVNLGACRFRGMLPWIALSCGGHSPALAFRSFIPVPVVPANSNCRFGKPLRFFTQLFNLHSRKPKRLTGLRRSNRVQKSDCNEVTDVVLTEPEESARLSSVQARWEPNGREHLANIRSN